jgi:hypothetical protein
MKPNVSIALRKFIGGGLVAIGCASCTSPSSDTVWQQAAVTAYVQKNLAEPASYQPVRWGPITAWRLGTVAKADLPMARQRYLDAVAKVQHDSAGFALVTQMGAKFGIAAADVALVEDRYRSSARERDTCSAQLRQLVATQNDTTLVFYQLVHTYAFKDEKGRTVRDSVQFNVGKQGVVVPLEYYRISPRDKAPHAPASSLPPPPAPPALKHF